MEPEEPLFPKLAKRRTWQMVKKDLERVGIPDETKEGIADFHAAGRHSYITGLLRSGVSVPHAMALARHSDVRMTMRYTHLGIDEQAKALKSLPGSWQDIGRKSGVLSLPAKSSTVSPRHKQDAGRDDVSPDGLSPCDTDRHKKAPPVTGGAEWRRRESNPESDSSNALSDKELTETVLGLAADWQRMLCQLLASDGVDGQVGDELELLISTWPSLPRHLRNVIFSTLDSVQEQ